VVRNVNNASIYYTLNTWKNEIAKIFKYVRRYRFENNFVGPLK